MDTVKIGTGLFQYTATDDCTRMRVLALYPKRNAATSVRFLRDHVLGRADARPEFPFPVQRVQTDRGGEFSRPAEAGGGVDFQIALMEERIRFRPIRLSPPHPAADGGRNGKVERLQGTDWMDFHTTVDLKVPDLLDRLKEWQHFYNEVRPHGGSEADHRSPSTAVRPAASRRAPPWPRPTTRTRRTTCGSGTTPSTKGSGHHHDDPPSSPRSTHAQPGNGVRNLYTRASQLAAARRRRAPASSQYPTSGVSSTLNYR